MDGIWGFSHFFTFLTKPHGCEPHSRLWKKLPHFSILHFCSTYFPCCYDKMPSKYLKDGWRDSSVVKNAGYSFKGPGHDSKHLHSSSQLPVTFQGIWSTFWIPWAPGRHVNIDIHTDKTLIHLNYKNLKLLNTVKKS